LVRPLPRKPLTQTNGNILDARMTAPACTTTAPGTTTHRSDALFPKIRLSSATVPTSTAMFMTFPCVLLFKNLVDSVCAFSRSMAVIAVSSASFVNAASPAFLGPLGHLHVFRALGGVHGAGCPWWGLGWGRIDQRLSGLSNAKFSKGAIGEGLSIVENRLAGSTLLETGTRTIPVLSTVVDSTWQSLHSAPVAQCEIYVTRHGSILKPYFSFFWGCYRASFSSWISQR